MDPADVRRWLSVADLPAWERLYDAWGPRLHAYLAGVLGSRALADEALQEVFVRLAEKAPLVAAAADPLAYALRLAANVARGLSRRTTLPPAYDPDLCAAPGAPAADPEQAAAVRAALAELPAEQREVVLLKVWEGRTFAELAAILAISPNTAASRWRYAIVKLRAALAERAHG